MTGSQLIIPAFTKGKLQLGGHEVEASRKMSSVRIHVERVIGLLKNRCTILQGTIPYNSQRVKLMRLVMKQQFLVLTRLVTVCAALINLGEGIVVKWVNKGYIQKISHRGEGTVCFFLSLQTLQYQVSRGTVFRLGRMHGRWTQRISIWRTDGLANSCSSSSLHHWNLQKIDTKSSHTSDYLGSDSADNTRERSCHIGKNSRANYSPGLSTKKL